MNLNIPEKAKEQFMKTFTLTKNKSVNKKQINPKAERKRKTCIEVDEFAEVNIPSFEFFSEKMQKSLIYMPCIILKMS
jgi:hypothetical protein